MPDLPSIAELESALVGRIADRSARIGVLGLGYVGLPLTRAFAEKGLSVVGFDVDRSKVDRLRAGESYVKTVSGEAIGDWIRRGVFDPTDDFDRLGEVDAALICVPTPLDEHKDPDLGYVESTARAIAKRLRRGQLIVLESTTYPGTTRDVVRPILESSGLSAERDFFLAYSPEREDPGNARFTATNIPKVVGGLTPAALNVACALYAQAVVEVVPVSSCEAAEAAKILENTYRCVNIALVNELKVVFDRMGIDVWEVIRAAATKPFGFQPFYPGPGLGGHCIPIDPFYLSWIARKYDATARFIELAGEINERMPEYVVDRVIDALNDHGKPVRGSRICILGMAYKKDVDDPRESPSFRLLELLQKRGADLSYHDPHIPTLPRMRSFDVPPLASEPLTDAFLASQDCLLIATDHSAVDYARVVRLSRCVVDARNATGQVTEGREKIYRA